MVLLHKYNLRDYDSQMWEEKAKFEVRFVFHDKEYFFIGKDGNGYCGSTYRF